MNKKGQMSIEFIITILFILFVFGFGLFLLQSRVAFNNNSFVAWEAQQIADRIARNINSVALMDNNAITVDYIHWSGPNKSIDFSSRNVQVNYIGGNFADSAIFFDINNLVDIFDGEIIFEKKNNIVVIRNA